MLSEPRATQLLSCTLPRSEVMSLNLEDPETTESALFTIIGISIGVNALLGAAQWTLQRNETGLERIFSSLIGTLLASFGLHFVCILFGAPLFENLARTFLFSLLVATLTALPSLISLGLEPRLLIRVFLRRTTETKTELRYYVLVASVLLGAWTGAIPMPLDKDRPWQVWPISCTYGAIIGYLFGLLVGYIVTEVFGRVELCPASSVSDGNESEDEHEHNE